MAGWLGSLSVSFYLSFLNYTIQVGNEVLSTVLSEILRFPLKTMGPHWILPFLDAHPFSQLPNSPDCCWDSIWPPCRLSSMCVCACVHAHAQECRLTLMHQSMHKSICTCEVERTQYWHLCLKGTLLLVWRHYRGSVLIATWLCKFPSFYFRWVIFLNIYLNANKITFLRLSHTL